jgi:hypothetical protein
MIVLKPKNLLGRRDDATATLGERISKSERRQCEGKLREAGFHALARLFLHFFSDIGTGRKLRDQIAQSWWQYSAAYFTRQMTATKARSFATP